MDASAEQFEPHRGALIAHCYRMLGSVAEAEEAVQDAFVRAWGAWSGFEGRGSVRSWLYAIATRVCLDLLRTRRSRTLPMLVVSPAVPGAPLPGPSAEHAWIEPMPDTLLFGSSPPGPEARLSARESVALAYLAAIQSLPPVQRAALLLRDVLGLSADEVATALDMTVPAANSALQRARASQAARAEARDVGPGAEDPVVIAAVQRFVEAWERGSADDVAAILCEDARFAMPPMALWFEGRDAIRAFLGGLFAMGSADRFRALPTAANGSAAVVLYERGADGAYRASAIDVFAVHDGGIAEIVAWLAPDPALLVRFGVPAVLAATTAPSRSTGTPAR